MRKGSKQGDRREEIEGRGAAGKSSARLCLKEEERESWVNDKNVKMLGLGLKTSNRSDRFGLPVGPVRLCQNYFNSQILNFKHRGVTILPLKQISSRDLKGKGQNWWLTFGNCIELMRIDYETLRTCPSVVLDIQESQGNTWSKINSNEKSTPSGAHEINRKPGIDWIKFFLIVMNHWSIKEKFSSKNYSCSIIFIIFINWVAWHRMHMF